MAAGAPRMTRVVAAGVWWVRARVCVVPEGGQHPRCVLRAAAAAAAPPAAVSLSPLLMLLQRAGTDLGGP